jgi:EmrB/QacA subfamily drug resistance transporter
MTTTSVQTRSRSRRPWITLGVLCVTILVISIDNTILNIALPTIVRTLHATSSQLQWVVDAYAVTFAGLLLTVGSLGDRFGRKWVFLGGLVVFAGGSAGAAWSGSPDRLTLARIVMGIGAAALMPSTLSILVNVFPDANDKRRAIGVWSGSAGIGVAAGPILGGVLLSHFWWGSVFLINVPICLIGIAATIFLVPNSRNPISRKTDPVGAGLSIVALGLLLWGIIEAPNLSWTSPTILASLGIGVVAIVAFVIWEIRSRSPVLPLQFFSNRRFSAGVSALALVLFALLGMFFLVTQYLQFTLGYSPLDTGLRIGPIALTLLVVAPVAVYLAHRFGTKPVVGAGLGLITLGLILLSRTSITTTYLGDLAPLLLIGIGSGLAMPPCTESVMSSVPLSDAGVGSATNDTAMQIGGALGVAALGTCLNARYQDHVRAALGTHAVPHAVQQAILGSVGGALQVAQRLPGPFASELARLARQSFISGMDLSLVLAAIVIAAASIVVVFALPNHQSQLETPKSEDVDDADDTAHAPDEESVPVGS